MSHSQEQERFARIFRDHLQADVPDASGGGHVPRRLVQFWDKEPPEDVAQMLALSKAWADKHQIDYVLYSEADARAYLADRDVDGKPLLDLFDRCFHPAMKADLFRLVYLHEFGGYYLDADNGATDAALALFGLDRDIFFLDFGQRRVQNNFMAVGPGSRLIGNVLSAAATNILGRASEDVGIGTLTGPYVFTVELAKLIEEGQYACYLVDYLKNLKIAPGPEAVLGQNLSYKKTDQNWQRAQAGPIAARLREQLRSGAPKISDFRELCRISLKFGMDLEAVEEIAAANWSTWENRAACIMLRSRVLIRLQRYAEARKILTEAYDRNVRPPAVLKALSGLNMKPGGLVFAERLARSAVNMVSDDPEAHAQLAAVLKARQKFAEAKAIVQAVRPRFPLNPRLRQLAGTLEDAASLEEEIAGMKVHLAAPEDTGRVRFLSLAQTCLEYNLHLDAVEDLAAIWWPVWHDGPMCVWLRARALEKLGREPEARSLLEEAREKQLGSPRILLMLARLSLAAGELEVAEGLTDEVIAMAPDRVDARVMRVKVLVAQGKMDDANAVRTCLQECHARHPQVVALERSLAGDDAQR